MCVTIALIARLPEVCCNVQQRQWVAQGKKAKAAARPKTYALHEDEDGWEGIQEAQNAAATRALFQVTAPPPPPPPQPPSFPHTLACLTQLSYPSHLQAHCRPAIMQSEV